MLPFSFHSTFTSTHTYDLVKTTLSGSYVNASVTTTNQNAWNFNWFTLSLLVAIYWSLLMKFSGIMFSIMSVWFMVLIIAISTSDYNSVSNSAAMKTTLKIRKRKRQKVDSSLGIKLIINQFIIKYHGFLDRCWGLLTFTQLGIYALISSFTIALIITRNIVTSWLCIITREILTFIFI